MASCETVLVLPDSQNGFRGDEPLHDRLAWEASLVLAELVDLDGVVLLGDMLDFSTLTKKFRKHADLIGKVGKSRDETRWWLDRLAGVTADVKFRKYLEGNHEARLANTVIDANEDLEGLLTVPGFLGLDDLGYDYVGPYGRDWTYRGVIYTHGEKYAKLGGQTAAKYLSENSLSVVFGHCHKAEYGMRRYQHKTRFAACPGTLARIDGIVPGNSPNPDWQQGLGLVHYDKNTAWYEHVPVEEGYLFFRGQRIKIQHNASARKRALGF